MVNSFDLFYKLYFTQDKKTHVSRWGTAINTETTGLYLWTAQLWLQVGSFVYWTALHPNMVWHMTPYILDHGYDPCEE